jgi:hypothetical protein
MGLPETNYITEQEYLATERFATENTSIFKEKFLLWLEHQKHIMKFSLILWGN